MELQGNEISANLFRSIREPVLMLSPAITGIMDMFRSVIADDNATAMNDISNQMAAAGILISGMTGASQIIGQQEQEAPEDKWGWTGMLPSLSLGLG